MKVNFNLQLPSDIEFINNMYTLNSDVYVFDFDVTNGLDTSVERDYTTLGVFHKEYSKISLNTKKLSSYVFFDSINEVKRFKNFYLNEVKGMEVPFLFPTHTLQEKDLEFESPYFVRLRGFYHSSMYVRHRQTLMLLYLQPFDDFMINPNTINHNTTYTRFKVLSTSVVNDFTNEMCGLVQYDLVHFDNDAITIKYHKIPINLDSVQVSPNQKFIATCGISLVTDEINNF